MGKKTEITVVRIANNGARFAITDLFLQHLPAVGSTLSVEVPGTEDDDAYSEFLVVGHHYYGSTKQSKASVELHVRHKADIALLEGDKADGSLANITLTGGSNHLEGAPAQVDTAVDISYVKRVKGGTLRELLNLKRQAHVPTIGDEAFLHEDGKPVVFKVLERRFSYNPAGRPCVDILVLRADACI